MGGVGARQHHAATAATPGCTTARCLLLHPQQCTATGMQYFEVWCPPGRYRTNAEQYSYRAAAHLGVHVLQVIYLHAVLQVRAADRRGTKALWVNEQTNSEINKLTQI